MTKACTKLDSTFYLSFAIHDLGQKLFFSILHCTVYSSGNAPYQSSCFKKAYCLFLCSVSNGWIGTAAKVFHKNPSSKQRKKREKNRHITRTKIPKIPNLVYQKH